MTDEGKRVLEAFVARRDTYKAMRNDFQQFARRHSETYARQYMQKRLGALALVVGAVVFYFAGPGLEQWLSMTAVLLGTMAVVTARTDKIDVWQLTIRYLKEHDLPQEDKELAHRVFLAERHLADLPELQKGIEDELFTQDDLDDMGIGVEI